MPQFSNLNMPVSIVSSMNVIQKVIYSIILFIKYALILYSIFSNIKYKSTKKSEFIDNILFV